MNEMPIGRLEDRTGGYFTFRLPVISIIFIGSKKGTLQLSVLVQGQFGALETASLFANLTDNSYLKSQLTNSTSVKRMCALAVCSQISNSMVVKQAIIQIAFKREKTNDYCKIKRYYLHKQSVTLIIKQNGSEMSIN